MNIETMKELAQRIKQQKPLIHHITNLVTINDCANITLAIGASPIMAMDIKEVEEVVSISHVLVLNMGTLNENIVKSMILAGKKANQLNIPIILDPVGVGVSTFRKEAVRNLIENVQISIIKGNESEIKTLSGIEPKCKGIDSQGTQDIDGLKNICQQLSKQTNSVIVATGKTDVISFLEETVYIHRGNEILTNITGTGCMTASLIGSYAAITNNMLDAAIAGVQSMNIAGEIAYEKMMNIGGGAGSFKVLLMDVVSTIESCEKYHI